MNWQVAEKKDLKMFQMQGRKLFCLAASFVAGLSLSSCKTAETARNSTNDVKSSESKDTSDTGARPALTGVTIDASDDLARIIYERARQEIEGGSSSIGASEVRSLMGAESFSYQVLAMENAGRKVKKLGDADAVQVQIEGTYMRTTDVYENPEGPEDACLRFTAASGLRRSENGWELQEEKAGFAVLSESVVSCE